METAGLLWGSNQTIPVVLVSSISILVWVWQDFSWKENRPTLEVDLMLPCRRVKVWLCPRFCNLHSSRRIPQFDGPLHLTRSFQARKALNNFGTTTEQLYSLWTYLFNTPQRFVLMQVLMCIFIQHNIFPWLLSLKQIQIRVLCKCMCVKRHSTVCQVHSFLATSLTWSEWAYM